MTFRSRWASTAAIGLAFAVLLVAQSITDHQLRTERVPARGAVGRAGFAYLTGLRTFGAAVLWNRIEPVFHEYYEDVPLAEQTYILPTIWMAVTLDPQLVQAYYVGAFQLSRRGMVEEGLELAREGVEANPSSGLLLTSYAQLLWLYGNDIPLAVEMADAALDAEWADAVEQHDGMAVVRGVYDAAGMHAKADAVEHVIELLDEQIGDALPSGAHDHDGDGEPDH